MKKYDQADLSGYKLSFLDCRPGMSGHRWKWMTDYKIVRNYRGDIVEFSRKRKCTRCEATSVKVYDGRTGRVLRRWYSYESNYMIDSTKLEVEPGMVVLESLRRSVASGKAVEDE